MVTNPFGSNQRITLEQNKIPKVIVITRKTVRFGGTVFQTCNISGFDETEVDIGSIPWSLIAMVFIVGSTIISFNDSFLGWLFILAVISGVVWNFTKPKHYGLLLTLNSGDKKLFTTTDKPGLRTVISAIYDFIETEKNVSYEITISNSRVKGNFVQGDVGGNATFNED